LLLALAALVTCTSTRNERGDADACPRGLAELSLRVVGGATFCVGGPTSCSNEWLTILGRDGALVLDAPCLADCAVCEPVYCPLLCRAPIFMPAEGVKRTWDGTIFVAQTCGAGTPCYRRTCARPGRYTARMCAYEALAQPGYCSPAPAPTCVEIGFDWPPAGETVTLDGVIGGASDAGASDASDAGRCCPPGWGMYSCVLPDGGAGLNCHNPAMACPSSSTCGGGCDFIATGRCG